MIPQTCFIEFESEIWPHRINSRMFPYSKHVFVKGTVWMDAFLYWNTTRPSVLSQKSEDCYGVTWLLFILLFSRLWTGCAKFPLRLSWPRHFEGIFSPYEHCSSPFPVGFTPAQTLSGSFFSHGLNCAHTSRISHWTEKTHSCRLHPASQNVCSITGAYKHAVFVYKTTGSISLCSRIHVRTCVICIQESGLMP